MWALPSLLPTPSSHKATLLRSSFCRFQAKKKFFDTELENLERQQKQQVEKMEQDHAVRRREEARRIRLEQERDHARFQEQLRLMKKEVSALGSGEGEGRCKRPKPQLGLAAGGHRGRWQSSRPGVARSVPRPHP